MAIHLLIRMNHLPFFVHLRSGHRMAVVGLAVAHLSTPSSGGMRLLRFILSRRKGELNFEEHLQFGSSNAALSLGRAPCRCPKCSSLATASILFSNHWNHFHPLFTIPAFHSRCLCETHQSRRWQHWQGHRIAPISAPAPPQQTPKGRLAGNGGQRRRSLICSVRCCNCLVATFSIAL